MEVFAATKKQLLCGIGKKEFLQERFLFVCEITLSSNVKIILRVYCLTQ